MTDKPHYVPKRMTNGLGQFMGWRLYTRSWLGLTFAGYLWSKS